MSRSISRRRGLIAAGLLMIFALPGAAAASEPSPAKSETPLYRETPCFFTYEGPRETACGTLYLPESRVGASERVISLPIVTFKSVAADKHPDPVVFINGGPGMPALGDEEQMQQAWGAERLEEHEWLTGRDLIVFDSRGVGLAEPFLDCPEFDRQARGAPDEEQAPMSFDDGLNLLQVCRDRLAGTGVDLAAYNTPENAADLHDMRRALGLESWNLWGSSYGTRVALEALRQDADGIRTLILAGSYPPGVGVPRDTAESMDYVLNKIFERCGAQRKCRRYFKDLRESFFAALSTLETDPLAVKYDIEETGERVQVPLEAVHFMNLIFNMVYWREGVEIIPNLIQEVENRSPRILVFAVQQVTQTMAGQATGTHWATRCNDGAGLTEEVRQDRIERFPHLANWISKSLDPRFCEIWNGGQAPALDPSPVESQTPVLFLAGEYDPVTPIYWARKAAETLPASQLFVFPGQTHSVAESPCAHRIMQQFLADPTTRPTHACFAMETEPIFSVRE